MHTEEILLKDYDKHPLLSRLLELHDVPKKLHIQGDIPNITIDEYGRAIPRILTIVGSRKNTAYGRQALEMLVAGLKEYNVIILSGLALGIDSLAHKNALTNNLITIAIPGSGLDRKVLYPSSHNNLADEIIASGGALLSELGGDTPAAPWTFPMRNRIMAALSDAVLIIEAEEKSGTLITARQALELGRDIGAVPGEIFTPSAAGTNMLIHEGAYPITSIDDLLSLLHLSKNQIEEKTSTKNYTGNEKIIMDILYEPLDKDTLFSKTELSFEDFITAFSSLEINAQLCESFGEVRRIV
jgi:DNA processing protein